MFPTVIGTESATGEHCFMVQASTHDTHRTVECRPNVVIHAFDKIVVGLTSFAATNQYLAGIVPRIGQ